MLYKIIFLKSEIIDIVPIAVSLQHKSLRQMALIQWLAALVAAELGNECTSYAAYCIKTAYALQLLITQKLTFIRLYVQQRTRRSATARTTVRLPAEITDKMQLVGGDVVGKKGPIFTTAVIGGVQAAKRTSSLIPFCHPLPLEDCKIDIALLENGSLVQVSFTS
jgi:MoaC family